MIISRGKDLSITFSLAIITYHLQSVLPQFSLLRYQPELICQPWHRFIKQISWILTAGEQDTEQRAEQLLLQSTGSFSLGNGLPPSQEKLGHEI